jgi:hypothetical protein
MKKINIIFIIILIFVLFFIGFIIIHMLKQNVIENNVCSSNMSCICKDKCKILRQGYSDWYSWIYNAKSECWCVLEDNTTIRLF